MTFYEWFTAQCVTHNTTPSAVAVAVGVASRSKRLERRLHAEICHSHAHRELLWRKIQCPDHRRYPANPKRRRKSAPAFLPYHDGGAEAHDVCIH